MKENILKTKSYKYALNIIALYKILSAKNEYILSRQLLRSGTSVGANIREANNAQSPKDFVAKLYISQKECDESMYWLELLKDSDYISSTDFNNVYKEAEEIIRILKSSILTTKEKNHRKFRT